MFLDVLGGGLAFSGLCWCGNCGWGFGFDVWGGTAGGVLGFGCVLCAGWFGHGCTFWSWMADLVVLAGLAIS